jgi:hypothetical protein
LRRRELKRLFARRWGLVLPDDDSGRDDVQLFADHCGGYGFNLLQQFCRMFAPWLSADDMVEVFRIRRVVKWTADALGEKLRLTDEERTTLKIRTIGAFDARSRRGQSDERVGTGNGRQSAGPQAEKREKQMKIEAGQTFIRERGFRRPDEDRQGGSSGFATCPARNHRLRHRVHPH